MYRKQTSPPSITPDAEGHPQVPHEGSVGLVMLRERQYGNEIPHCETAHLDSDTLCCQSIHIQAYM